MGKSDGLRFEGVPGHRPKGMSRPLEAALSGSPSPPNCMAELPTIMTASLERSATARYAWVLCGQGVLSSSGEFIWESHSERGMFVRNVRKGGHDGERGRILTRVPILWSFHASPPTGPGGLNGK